MSKDIPAHHLKRGQLLFLTDAEAETLCNSDMDMESCVGHYAIALYHKINEEDFKHFESTIEVPLVIAREVSRGHMVRLAAASDNGDPTWRYNLPGTKRGFRSRPVTLEEKATQEYPQGKIPKDVLDMLLAKIDAWMATNYPCETALLQRIYEGIAEGTSSHSSSGGPFCAVKLITVYFIWHDEERTFPGAEGILEKLHKYLTENSEA